MNPGAREGNCRETYSRGRLDAENQNRDKEVQNRPDAPLLPDLLASGAYWDSRAALPVKAVVLRFPSTHHEIAGIAGKAGHSSATWAVGVSRIGAGRSEAAERKNAARRTAGKRRHAGRAATRRADTTPRARLPKPRAVSFSQLPCCVPRSQVSPGPPPRKSLLER